MAIQSMQLDPSASALTPDQIVTLVNTATTQITRTSCVAPAARPIGTSEITNSHLTPGVSRQNLDAMADTARGYVKTNPVVGEFPVIAVQRQSDGKFDVEYDDEAIT